jgi:hypothetical protein
MRKARKNVVGLRLRILRLKNNLSQHSFAEACQRKGWRITRDIIARIEVGARCVSDFEILLLAACLKVEAVELLPIPRDWNRLRRTFVELD